MIFDIRHITKIRYEAEIRIARFNLRLQPAPWPGQTVSGYRLIVRPVPITMVTEEGPYVVTISRLMVRDPIKQLHIESRFTVGVTPAEMPDASLSPSIAHIRQHDIILRDISKYGPANYLYATGITAQEPEIAAWARPFLSDAAAPALLAACGLMQALYDEFQYDSDATHAGTMPIEAFRQRRGVCQDFAHILLIALRAYGLSAAYVSGYLRTIPPPGKERLVGADATHAWVNLWCGEEMGWVGLDPTNNCIVTGDHIFTAMGRDYADVAPVDGIFYGGAGQGMQVSVDVAPREEKALPST